MWLLLKWLRPETVPSPRRKKIPLGMRLQLQFYRSCLRILRKWYARYAFSDSILLTGNPAIRVYHEFRDIAFEAELKRLRLSLPERMLECSGTSSSLRNGRKGLRFYRCYHFEDSFLLDIDGQKVSIKHGQSHSFVSTLNGCLKEAEPTSLIPKYAFSGRRRDVKVSGTNKGIDISSSIAGSGPQRRGIPDNPTSFSRSDNGPSIRKGTGHLFGDDPLFGKIQEKPNPPVATPPPSIKNVEGVSIDESF